MFINLLHSVAVLAFAYYESQGADVFDSKLMPVFMETYTDQVWDHAYIVDHLLRFEVLHVVQRSTVRHINLVSKLQIISMRLC